MRLSGEQKLAFAVMLRTLRDFVTPINHYSDSHSNIYPNREEILEARLWVEEEREYVYSLAWCCYAIGVDPLRVRRQILHLWRTDPDKLRAAIDELENFLGAQSRGCASTPAALPAIEPKAISMSQRVKLLRPCDLAKLRIPSQPAIEQLALFA